MIYEIDVRGDERAQKRLLDLGDQARHARPAFEEIADVLIGVERAKFRASRWRLAESTKQRKDRQGLDPRALHSSGLLQRTLTARTPTARSHGLLLEISDDEVRYGIKGGRTDIFYGRILEKGARNRRRGGTLPSRAVIPGKLSPKTRAEFKSILRRHLVRSGAAPLSLLDL